MNKNGFTLIEIIITAVIFAIAAAGIFATISILKSPAGVSEHKLNAAYYGKQILEDLRAQVDQNTWEVAGTELSVGTHPVSKTIDGITYTGTYTVTQEPNGSRKVVLTINWNEP